VLILLDK
jgi:hypothetical protein